MQYKILKISQDPPREWGEGDNKTYYIKVMLEGHDKPVSIGKKDPHALKVGDVVTGTITETQYDTDKFVADKPAFGGKSRPRDDMAIRAQWAIGQAMNTLGVTSADELSPVESLANQLFSMVDRVKDSKPEPKRDWTSLGKPKEVDEVQNEFDAEEPIDLSEIPF